MALKKYRSKRNLKTSLEPRGGKSGAEKMHFCVQRHDASHLHYDVRLEYKGVLLSWAVPKGPSLDPQDKRLAIHVEDHPLDYQYFEGVIPKGHYGAGTVVIWDKGSFEVPEGATRKEIEKKLTLGLKKGHFAVILKGKKLKGEFVFQKLKKDKDDHSWLMIKKADSSVKRSTGIKKSKKKIPEWVPPMLGVLIDEPFNDEDWLFEVKWDGFRALSFIGGKQVKIFSRNHLSFNKQFPEIAQSFKHVKESLILDGEIVVLDESGRSHFQMIQNYRQGTGTLCYYVFDLLYQNGEDLRELPLIERKALLKQVIKKIGRPNIRYSDHIQGQGKNFFRAAEKAHLEGIMGKKASSPYQSKRSHDWVKIKTSVRQEVVVCGFTEPRGSRKKFGSLIAGIYGRDKKLHYAGHVGGGFNESLLKQIYDQLQPLIQKKSPFSEAPKVNAPVTWVKPKLLMEVSFTEWTSDQRMRHPIFLGLRKDKKGTSVVKEEPVSIKKQKLTHLEKIYWPKEKYTKGDLIEYYRMVAPFILPYLKKRPIMLHRYPNGINGESFYQKDIPYQEGIKTFSLQHERKTVNYLLIHDLKSLLFAINLGSIDLHPFLSSVDHIEFPDFCVIDLDPHDISFKKVVEAALVVHEILDTIKVPHFCKTSGGKGLHILIPLHGKYDYEESRQFAEIICHIVHQRLPKTTSMERPSRLRPKKIYLDCLQNRSGQSIAAPYAVRPRPKATVSTPLSWDEVNAKLDPTQFTIKTLPQRLKKKGDLLKPLLKKRMNMAKALSALQED